VGVDDEYVRAADRLRKPAMNFTIRERSDVGLADLNVEYVGDSLGEFSAIAAREQRQPLLGDLFHVSSRLALGDQAIGCQAPGVGKTVKGSRIRRGGTSTPRSTEWGICASLPIVASIR